jgi:formylglycine-generating enzyme required for sulfatase activity
VQVRSKQVENLRREFDKTREAAKTLETKPNDPEANAVMGRFLCLQKGRWEQGLPLLARGGDSLKELAAKDLAAPATGADQLALGNAWWDLAAKEQGHARTNLQRRAHAWYVRALPRLSGEDKATVGTRIAQLEKQFAASLPKLTVNSIGMTLALIPSGKFLMGAPESEPHWAHEAPQHEVTLSQPFYVGIYKVTVGQFGAFVKETGYKTEAETSGGATGRAPDGKWAKDPACNWRNPGFAQTDDHPVVCVSWNDTQAFCAWLSKKEAHTYHLPTEAQWEYACRAGSRTRYYFGDSDADLPNYAWFGPNADMQSQPVGRKKPNAWGLYDMHGNVWEWTADWFNTDYYKESPKQDPLGPTQTVGARAVRGGGWDYGSNQ